MGFINRAPANKALQTDERRVSVSADCHGALSPLAAERQNRWAADRFDGVPVRFRPDGEGTSPPNRRPPQWLEGVLSAKGEAR